MRCAAHLQRAALQLDADVVCFFWCASDLKSLFYIPSQVKVEDEEVLAKFMAPAGAAAQQRTLSDIIMERIRTKQAGGDASENAQ